jgi:oxygen-independent coproporphyrinogen III oxidase
MPDPYSLYIHIPFCTHRCAYCDFNTYAGQEGSIAAYVTALCNEIQVVGRDDSRIIPTHTIFFGGGTPSLLSSAQFSDIFNTIRQNFELTPEAEISLEANPGTTSAIYLQKLRSVGFNRISFGVQSANPDELRMLERIHDFFDVMDSVKWARQAGFDNLNLDLIYGLPEQTLEKWQNTVKRATDLHPEHISAYSLTLEHGTPFGHWAQRGLLPIPDPDLAADMYEWTMEFLGGLGYEQYEISNWSLPGRECRHNLQYWRNLNYLGLGAGAHGYVDSVRYSNVLRIKTYIDRLTSDLALSGFPLSPATVNDHKNTQHDDMQETMMTGLRLTHEGVSAQVFRERFGVDLMDVFGKEINELVRLGLLEWMNNLQNNKGGDLRLTYRGRLLGNQVFMRFVGE